MRPFDVEKTLCRVYGFVIKIRNDKDVICMCVIVVFFVVMIICGLNVVNS